MKRLFSLYLIIVLSLNSCSDKNEKYPVDKPVWDIEDYQSVTQEIVYGTPEGEKLPTVADNPEVFNKLVDKESVAKVLDDESLGLQYRQEYSEELFNAYRTLIDGYSELDRQDKFVYPMEVVKLRDWGSFVQIKYFKLGNDGIRKDAVNPEDPEVQSVIGSNKQTVVGNFTNGISFLTNEDALTTEALNEYSVSLKNNYTTLIETFKGADLSTMKSTIEDILKKVKSEKVKEALVEIKKLIESKSTESNTSI